MTFAHLAALLAFLARCLPYLPAPLRPWAIGWAVRAWPVVGMAWGWVRAVGLRL